MPTRVEVENSISILAELSTAMQLTVDDDCLFDEITCLKNYIYRRKVDRMAR